MIDRKKVIKGLECCLVQTDEVPPLCEECPYCDEKIGTCEYFSGILSDAIALLKEQEPRLMTLEEVKEWKQPDVWIESDTANFIGEYIEPAGRMEFAFMSSIIVSDERHEDGTPITMSDQYGKKWRCWTARPTNKQREAIPWEK